MRSNPQVCVQADEVLDQGEWASVIVLGRYEELPNTVEYEPLRKWAQSLLERRSLWWQAAYAASQIRPHRHAHTSIFYRIHIQEMSGVRASPGERLVETWRLKS